jgi:hypothetical protein
LYKKSYDKESHLAYLGHALVENRNGLIAAAMATTADGYAEREAALQQAFKAHINTGKMRTSSRNRFRHSRKHRATPSDHANFNEFLDLQKNLRWNSSARLEIFLRSRCLSHRH